MKPSRPMFGQWVLLASLASGFFVPASSGQTPEQTHCLAAQKRADAFKSRGKTAEAVAAYEEAIALAPAAFGANAASTGNLMINLAEMLAGQGNYAKAVPWYEKALKIREIRWGEEAEEAAVVRNNLALALSKLGDFTRAEKLHLATLKFKEDIFHPEHAEVALVHNNLGRVYQEKGDKRLAKTHLERALKIWETSKGPAHADTAIALGNLASFYQGVGQPQRAEELARRVLKIHEAQMNPKDDDLAIACNNLASILHQLGRSAEAMPVHRRAMALWEKKLGPDHPTIATALSNYAHLLTEIGEWDESEQLLTRSLAIRERGGAGPLEVAHALNNLGHLYAQQKRYEDAVKAHAHCLRLRQETLGLKHSDVGLSLNNLATVYQDLKRFAEAEKLYEQCLEVRRERFGPDHPEVASVLGNLATLAIEQNQVRKATALSRQHFTINRGQLGDQHPDTTQARISLGSLLAYQDQWDDVRDHFDQAVRQRVAEVRQMFAVLSEAEQLRYLAMRVEADMSMTLSWALHKRTDRRWRETSAAWIINAQGMTHEILAERALLARDSRTPRLAELAADLYDVRKQLAALAFAEVPREKDSGKIIADLLSRERELAKKLAESAGRPAHAWVDLDQVRRALPKDGVMIVLAKFRQRDLENPFNYAKARHHYAAWVIPPHGAGEVDIVPLGAAEPMEQSVSALRRAMADSPKQIRTEGEPDAEALLRKPLQALANLIYRPIGRTTRRRPKLVSGSRW